MKKNLTTYYSILAVAVVAQVILTVFSLSQNIGYGQKISFLENKRTELETQINKSRTQLAQKNALKELENQEGSDFVAITNTTLVDRSSSSIALR